jgi:hypothetical protein
MIQPSFSLNSAVTVAIGLVLFGVLYNQLIGWTERHGYLEGFTSLAVALGAAVTLGGVALLSWQAALLCLGAFTATGSPMIAGSIWRYISTRKTEQENERQAARLAERSPQRQGPGS